MFETENPHPYFCTICETGFAFKSRYEKYLQSSKHQFLSSMMQPDFGEQSLTEVNPLEDTQFFSGDYSKEVCSPLICSFEHYVHSCMVG